LTRRRKIYWLSQVSGWLFFVIFNIVFYGLSNEISLQTIFNFLLLFAMGIVFTHGYRYFILKYDILKLQIIYQMVFIVTASLFLSTVYFWIGSLFNISLFNLEVIVNGIVPFVFWSLIYFGFHYLENYKKTEIQNLRWEASSKDIELNKLKSQLNPHFMFNSMNSIRALIDEDPAKAKEAVTQLSNILRNTLLMNKSKEIFLEEELKIVKDYLDLEHIRYEERLRYHFHIQEEALKKIVPPLIVQSQVENAIKHGISKLPLGGEVEVRAKVADKDLLIEVNNTGTISHEKSETGFGLMNSRQRLELLYGHAATIDIFNMPDNTVSVKIKIPLK
jgi:two-component system, LytTR family, sensor kinase